MRKVLFSIVLSLIVLSNMSAQKPQHIMLSDSARIFLLTCTPGEEVWSKYGHTGIRVQDIPHKLDIVFNYGIFSLMEKGFYFCPAYDGNLQAVVTHKDGSKDIIIKEIELTE